MGFSYGKTPHRTAEPLFLHRFFVKSSGQILLCGQLPGQITPIFAKRRSIFSCSKFGLNFHFVKPSILIIFVDAMSNPKSCQSHCLQLCHVSIFSIHFCRLVKYLASHTVQHAAIEGKDQILVDPRGNHQLITSHN